MVSQNVIVFKNFGLPKEVGKHFRIVCMTGENKGHSYYLNSERIIMGRSENADIPILDLKASREHAEIKKTGEDYFITDLGSQNGMIINDEKVVQRKLVIGDLIIFGKTVFKFGMVEKKKEALPLDLNLNETKSEADLLISDIENIAKNKNKRTIIIAAFLLVAVFFLLDSGDQNKKDKRVNIEVEGEAITEEFSKLISKENLKEDKEVRKKLDSIFLEGLREQREGNFYRALSEFNLALILSPRNARAEYYLAKTKEKLDEELNIFFIKAKKDFDSLKYVTAMQSYCSIMRLLQYTPNDERYKLAKQNVDELEKIQGLDPGETKCL